VFVCISDVGNASLMATFLQRSAKLGQALLGLWVRKFHAENIRKFVNYLCQSAVSKSSIGKWCCKKSIFSPDLHALTLCIKEILVLACTAARNISEIEWKLWTL